MFFQLKKLLPREFNRHGIKSEVTAINVINAFKKHCADFLGEDALENLTPCFFKNKKLHVNAKNAAWAQHLHIKQSQLLEKINESLDGQTILGFVIQIKNNA